MAASDPPLSSSSDGGGSSDGSWRTDVSGEDSDSDDDFAPPGCSIVDPRAALSLVWAFCRQPAAGAAPTASLVVRQMGGPRHDVLVSMARRGAPPSEELARLRAENAAARERVLLQHGPPPSFFPSCGICTTAAADAVAGACGHAYACIVCAASLAACPICRVETQFVRLRFSAGP
jgi:hypothetical protein